MSNSSSGVSASDASAIQGYLNSSETLAALSGDPSATVPTESISGLVSGIDTTSIISALMSEAEQPQQALQSQLTTVNNTVTEWNAISSDATQLQTAADTITQPSSWDAFQATSSSSAVTPSVGSGASGGSLTFTVNDLAQAAALVSSGTVSSTNQQITSASSLLIAQGGSAIGLGGFSDGGGLGLGAHTIAVTQAAQGATVTSGSALPASTTLAASSTLTFTLGGGSPQTLTLAGGADLTPTQVAAQITAASNGALTASVNADGTLSIATTTQGSSQSLTVNGGSALSALGITTGASGTGVDGVVSVDGTSTTLNDVTPGGNVTLDTPGGGTMQATVTGPLDAGSVTAQEVSTGNGSLATVIAAINGSSLGVTASAVQVSADEYRLEIGSDTTGAATDVDVAPSALSGIGGMTVLNAGSDAQVTVGTGPGAFTFSSTTNTVTGLMPGVSLQLNATSSAPVTVSLTPDAAAMATQVNTLVEAVNALVTDMGTAMTLPSGNSSSTSTTSGTTSSSSGSSTSSSSSSALDGLLLGNTQADTLLDSVLSAVSGSSGANGEGSAGAVGITLNQNGTLSFDQTTFESAYNADPTAVANTFTQGGASTSSALMSLYQGADTAQAGTYPVTISQAATQASVTGATLAGGTVSGPETISIQAGTGSASYAAQSGESLADIASGINAATAQAGVGVEASISDNALTLTAVGYGSGGDFTVSSTAAGTGSTGLVSTAGGSTSAAGQDVVGTIDGQAGTGVGQLLLGALNTPASGLVVQVTATPAEVAAVDGNIGSMNYTPGLAAALASVANAAANPLNGTITSVVTGLQSQATDLQTQISNWDPILQQKEQTLQQEYTAMETALSSLDNTKSQLNSVFNSSSSG